MIMGFGWFVGWLFWKAWGESERACEFVFWGLEFGCIVFVSSLLMLLLCLMVSHWLGRRGDRVGSAHELRRINGKEEVNCHLQRQCRTKPKDHGNANLIVAHEIYLLVTTHCVNRPRDIKQMQGNPFASPNAMPDAVDSQKQPRPLLLYTRTTTTKMNALSFAHSGGPLLNPISCPSSSWKSLPGWLPGWQKGCRCPPKRPRRR